MVVQAREFNKARTTFIDTILTHQHHGRIHADINQMRSDTGGTSQDGSHIVILTYSRFQHGTRISDR